MFEIPSHAPSEFIAGDTVQWTASLRDFSSLDGWVLSYRAVGDTQEITAAKIAVAADGAGGWNVAIASADSDVPAGTYRLIGWVTLNGERHSILDHVIAIRANVATHTIADLQTPNQAILAAIDAKLSGRITADQETLQIEGNAITKIPIEKLVQLRGVYASKVWREFHPHQSYPVHKMRFR